MRNARTLVAGLGLLAVLALAAAWLSSGGTPGTPEKTFAAGPFAANDLRCSDVFLDLPPLAAKDGAPGVEDLRVAKALVSLETTGATTANIKTQGYGGIQSASVDPPDADTCQDDDDAGSPEANRFDDDTKFNSPNEAFGNVQTTATLVDKDSDTVVDHANFTSCFFSPTVGWVRTDTNTPLLKSAAAAGSVVHGESSVYIMTPVDANPCDDVTLPAAIRLITNDYKRDPRTDDTATNTTVAADPDGTQGTPPPQPQPADADAVFDDWDGDGCTDWDELARKDGGDPFNPDDCDKDYDGIFNILVTVAPSAKGPNGSTLPGIYFYCVANIEDPGTPAVRAVDAYLICYQDNGAATPRVERVNSGEDGLAGAPPPPPYGTGELTHLDGSYDQNTNTLTLAGCFTSVEGDLGPNVYVTATIGGDEPKKKGFVGINANEAKGNCNAGTPSGGPADELTALFIAEQPDDFDHDGDGCTDAQELDPTGARLGRDPYNPYDCEDDFYGSWSVLATAAAQNVCKGGAPSPFCDSNPEGTLVPGAYFHCRADSQPNGALGTTIRIRLGCYADVPGLPVNSHVGTDTGGDGLGGVAPPAPFAEVHNLINFIDGTIAGNVITAEGCLANLHGALGPNSYVEATLNGATGVGTADIWTARADCSDPGVAIPTFDNAVIQTAEQGGVIDSDDDNCLDYQELSDTGATGGLRDPYNIGDFMSVHTGPVANLQKDASVTVADISATVARFGANDSGGSTKINRNTDPKSRPIGVGYHPSYDRGGPIPNGGGGVSRQTPATTGSGAGSVTVADISAVVAQFGATCLGGTVARNVNVMNMTGSSGTLVIQEGKCSLGGPKSDNVASFAGLANNATSANTVVQVRATGVAYYSAYKVGSVYATSCVDDAFVNGAPNPLTLHVMN
jgi:hypothetical protein